MNLTYDIWNAIIDDVVEAYSFLFEAMQTAGEQIRLTKPLIDDLRLKGIKIVADEEFQFWLVMDPHEDKIGGFRVVLIAFEDLDLFEAVEDDIAMAHGITYDDIRGFEVEHGLSMEDDILDAVEEGFHISGERLEKGLAFELEIFDSEDLDNSRKAMDTWNAESS